MCLGTTPRMPPSRFGIAAVIAAILLIAYFTVASLVGEGVTYWVLPVSWGLSLAVALSRTVQQARRRRQVVRYLRQFDTSQRLPALLAMNEHWGLEPLHAAAAHGAPEQRGLTERFAFSKIDRRECDIFFWISVAGAVLAVGTAATVTVNGVIRLIAFASVPGFAMLVRHLNRKQTELRRVFEVSPFGLSEISDERTRRVLWSNQLMLRNVPQRQQLEIGPATGSDCIAIPYALVGINRMLELILAYGGFVPAQGERAS